MERCGEGVRSPPSEFQVRTGGVFAGLPQIIGGRQHTARRRSRVRAPLTPEGEVSATRARLSRVHPHQASWATDTSSPPKRAIHDPAVNLPAYSYKPLPFAGTVIRW